MKTNNIMVLNKKTFYTVAAFSRSKIINGLHNVVASVYFRIDYGPEGLRPELMLERLRLLRGKRLIIINVLDSSEFIRDWYSLGKTYNTEMRLLDISYDAFFSKDGINNLILNDNDTTNYMIFHFEGKTWNQILLSFRKFNIIVSGGSYSKRHMLSNIELRLSEWILIVDGINRDKITQSYMLNDYLNKNNTRVKLDFTKEDFWKEINEEFKSETKTKSQDFKLSKNLNHPNISLNKLKIREYHTSRNIDKSGNKLNFSALYEINSPVYNVLYNTIIFEPINEITQLKIEKFLRSNYLEKLNEKEFQIKNKEINPIEYKNLNSNLLSLLNNSKFKINKLIDNFIKEHSNKIYNNKKILIYEVLENCSKDLICSILFGRILKIISNNGRVNNLTKSLDVFLDIGKDLVNQFLLNQYKEYIKFISSDSNSKEEIYNISFSTWKKNNYQLIEVYKDETLYLNIGSLLIGWLIEIKLIKHKIVTISRIEKHNILVADSEIKLIIPNNNLPILHLPNKIPMIVSPKKFIKDKDKEILGGYLLNDVEYTEYLIKDKWNLSVKGKINENNIIYDMVNSINNVEFKINTKVLDFILLNYNKYNLLIDLNYIHPLSTKSKLKKEEKQELESFYSKKDLEQNILGLANIFKEVSKFYLPIRLDYRGRLFSISEYLNYQGSDLAKSLLLFYKSEKVNLTDTMSINYLKIFGANCFGNKLEKASFIDRIKWVDDNIQDIINFYNGKLIAKSENKYLFIAFCFEYQNYLESLKNNASYFLTNLPIQLDASCNGFQHLSLLIKDLALSKELNLSSSNWYLKPKDFYSFISLKIKDFFKCEIKKNKKLGNLNEKNLTSYTFLSELNITRKLIKKVIMTYPYGVTPYSILIYFKEEFIKLDKDLYILKSDPNIKFTEVDFQSLRKALNIVLLKDYPKLNALIDYLKQIAKISNELGIPIPWILPSGLIVQQQFFSTKKTKFKPYIYSKDLLNVNFIDKTNYNNKKQIRSLMPNLVHSLDAASLALLINIFFKEYNQINFFSVHDCFAVTCNNVNKIMEILKQIYITVYSKDPYLLEFNECFLNNVIKTYGPDCFNPINNEITIEKNNKIKILPYPDVKKLININSLNIEDSTYLIH